MREITGGKSHTTPHTGNHMREITYGKSPYVITYGPYVIFRMWFWWPYVGPHVIITVCDPTCDHFFRWDVAGGACSRCDLFGCWWGSRCTLFVCYWYACCLCMLALCSTFLLLIIIMVPLYLRIQKYYFCFPKANLISFAERLGISNLIGEIFFYFY